MNPVALAVWLPVTIAIYLAAERLQRVTRSALLNPVLTSVAAVGLLLWRFDVPYDHYFDGARPLHWLLAPATVALAVPLAVQNARLHRAWLPILVAICAGLVTAVASAWAIAALLGASHQTLLSLAPKSVTTPIAIGIAEKIGGIPALSVLAVLITGTFGAVIVEALFRRMKIDDDAVKGIALGVSAHGVGTARAFQISAECGAFSGLAMALAGLITALLLPLMLRLLGLA
ncbi:MAG TPA: LrgB family protein [Solimonas sp.]|nr:LrgB family protein [Solimonas sp.]